MADDDKITVQAPIQPLKPKDKSKVFWKRVIVIFIAVVMAASTIGFMIGGNDENQEENLPANAFEVSGYTFYDLGDSYGTYIVAGNQKQPIQFRLDPRNASDIFLDDTAISSILSAKKIYITFDPAGKELGNVAIAAYEISRILGLYQIPAVGAYTRDTDPPDPNVPLKTCADASNITTVILIGLGNKTGVENENNCVHISGVNGTGLIDAADKLGMNLLGIKL